MIFYLNIPVIEYFTAIVIPSLKLSVNIAFIFPNNLYQF